MHNLLSYSKEYFYGSSRKLKSHICAEFPLYPFAHLLFMYIPIQIHSKCHFLG